jgi:DNA-binding MarR family transcriptional regulator
MEDREQLIERILDARRDLGRALLTGGAHPLLAVHLTMRQLKVLLICAVRGSCSGQELAGHMGVGLATLTGVVDRLAARGLVSRREDPGDRRVRLVELTERGRELVDEVLEARTRHLRGLLRRLDSEDLHAVERIMLRLSEVAREEGHAGGPAAVHGPDGSSP